MNTKPRETLAALMQAFPEAPDGMFPPTEEGMSLGLEIECSWRSYFPDLWVDGFPNVSAEEMQRITEECLKREAVLLPKLLRTVACGVPRGADRYWEFAFDPVTDVSIVCNQIAVLQANGLIPPGDHSLHITIGGIRVNRETYYLAFLIEMLLCSPERIGSAFHAANKKMSAGWARKGYAGVFEKEGRELMHGEYVAAEFRICELPGDLNKLYSALKLIQKYAKALHLMQHGSVSYEFLEMVGYARDILKKHHLSDENWKKPNLEPDMWTKFMAAYPLIREEFGSIINHYGV